MGQAQKSRHGNVRYADVELKLWELDRDDKRDEYARRVRRSSTGRIGNREKGRSGAEAIRGERGARDDRNRGGRAARSSAANARGEVTRIGGTARTRSRDTGRNAGSARPVQSIKRRRAKRRKVYFARAAALSFVVLCLVIIYFLTGELYRMMYDKQNRGGWPAWADKGAAEEPSEQSSGGRTAPPGLIEDYLEVNEFSRPGTPLGKVRNIFVHYTANPGTTAAQNRSYFANLAQTQERSASAHLIIGYDGELIQCIPFDEQAYAVMTRNEDSISIECCYTSEDGSFTRETYDTLVRTLAWLIDRYDLSEEDILRHYDCGGKMCPVYYVEHEEAWEQLLRDVAAYEGET